MLLKMQMKTQDQPFQRAEPVEYSKTHRSLLHNFWRAGIFGSNFLCERKARSKGYRKF